MRGVDERAVDLLCEQGDRASIPRTVTLWFYGERDELLDLKAALENTGWEVIPPEPADRTHMLRAWRDQETSAEAMTALRNEVESLIASTDIAFDGWETTVEVGQ